MKLIATLSSDLILKSPVVRRKFQRVLLNNIRQAFKDLAVKYTLEIDLGHIFLESQDKKALDILSRIFGLDSISIIEETCASDLDTICQRGVEIYQSLVKEGSYAVKAKRKGTHDFTSEDVNCKLGALLKTDRNRVNIKNSENPIHIYIKDKVSYFYTKRIKAQGGLPLGTGGKVVCLVSGGFDSILASWMMQKRGIQVDYLFCNLGGKAYERSTLEVTKQLVDLWGYGSSPKFYSLDFGPLVKEIKNKVKPSFNQVVLKKLFYKSAEKLCYYAKYDAIVTGEAIGQVSSQTLKNLRAIEDGSHFPILRPLLSSNKNEIMSKCYEIGTYELSAKIKEFCQITKAKPVTATTPKFLNHEFLQIDSELLHSCFKAYNKISLKKLDLSIQAEDYLIIDHIPKDSVILDCRTHEEYQKRSYPKIPHMEPYVFEKLSTFSKNQSYILFCQHTTQSLLLAEKMQKNGYTAYSLKGGEKTFIKHWEESLSKTHD